MNKLIQVGMMAAGAFATAGLWAAAGVSAGQEAVAKAAPREMKLMIASFGTINSQAEVEKWLGDQLKPSQNMEKPPTLSEAEKIADPNLESVVVRANWHTKKVEYLRATDEVRQENARRARILSNLKTSMLSEASQRYTQLGRDYLQSRIRREAGSLIKIVDRGNMQIQQTEKAISGKGDDVVNGADCVLSVVMGDREEDSKTIPVDNTGTMVKRTTYTAPYVGKIRDLDGNVLLAFDGTAEWRKTENSVVRSQTADPARKLMEAVCDKIAREVVAYFTTELRFRVKAPKGMDADDAEVTVDGRDVPTDGVRVLAFEHVVKGQLDGCKPIKRVVSIENDTSKLDVKMNFKVAKADTDAGADGE